MLSKIITISGIDGSGKSTCAEAVKDILQSMNMRAVVVDAMKNGVFIEMLQMLAQKNQIPLRQSFSPDLINLSWTLDLLYNHETLIKKLLMEGVYVVLHRSELCCRVYSRLFSPNNDMIDAILDRYCFNYHVNIYLDITPEVAFERVKRRSSHTEKETLGNMIQASKLYQKYLNDEKYKSFFRIDTEKSFESVYKNLKELSFLVI